VPIIDQLSLPHLYGSNVKPAVLASKELFVAFQVEQKELAEKLTKSHSNITLVSSFFLLDLSHLLPILNPPRSH
jgi:hypothetical protein